jgi:hypothetical protein
MILDNLSLVLGKIDIIRLVDIAIIIFSLMLLGLSINAYRRTGLKKLLFAAVAFALFTVQLLIEYADEVFNIFDEGQVDLVISGVILFTLIMFFLAIVRKK